MSPNSALLLVRLINGYSVLCTITGVIEVNMGIKWGREGWRVHNSSSILPIPLQSLKLK